MMINFYLAICDMTTFKTHYETLCERKKHTKYLNV
jgi:hypothetical protein